MKSLDIMNLEIRIAGDGVEVEEAQQDKSLV